MQKPPQINVIIVNFNGLACLKTLFESIFEQTVAPKAIIFIDNASQDNSLEWVEKHYQKQVTIIKNHQNLGFAKAANMGIEMSKNVEFITLLNPDIILTPTYFENALKPFEKDEKIAAVTGKVLLYDFEKNQPTQKIDTVGISCFRNRRFIDEGQGQIDEGQFQKSQEVFGVSGACPIYRQAALQNAKVHQEYFDEDFFMYKEDVDLSWRFRLFGWKNWYEATAVAYHGRGTKVLQKFSHWEVAKNRSKLSYAQKYFSYKNQRLMQIKNEFPQAFFADFFPIFLKETLISAYILFREPRLLKAVAKLFSQLPLAFKKRRYILKKSRLTWKELRPWFSKKLSR